MLLIYLTMVNPYLIYLQNQCQLYLKKNDKAYLLSCPKVLRRPGVLV
jgi:hypothetical protein